MPILDRRTNQFIEDKDTRVSVGIDFPIARSMPFHNKDVENQKAILYHIASLR